jgi:two-component system nitrate/nitrite response regulator NarL
VGPDKVGHTAPKQQAVVVVDRNLLFRAGLIHALDRSRFDVIAESSTLEDVPLNRLTVDAPILLLIGLESARIESVPSTLRDWRRRHDDLNIIMLYDHDWTGSLPSVRAEIGNVVDALLPKDSVSSESVCKALDLVLLGTSVVAREFLRPAEPGGANGAAAIAPVPGKSEAAAGPAPVNVLTTQQHSADGLTQREKLILSHLMKGDSNKVIARAIGIAESTVKIHVRNLMLKTDAKNRTQAAMWGYKNLL